MNDSTLIKTIHSKFERTVNNFQNLDRKDVLFIFRQAIQETAKEILEDFTVADLKFEVDKLFNYMTDYGRNVVDAKLMKEQKSGQTLFRLKQKVDSLYRKNKLAKIRKSGVKVRIKLRMVGQRSFRIEETVQEEPSPEVLRYL